MHKVDPENPSKLVFMTVAELNAWDGVVSGGEKVYWREERVGGTKLEIRVKYEGLYCLEFDNSYSWVIPKHVKYRLEMYQPLENEKESNGSNKK